MNVTLPRQVARRVDVAADLLGTSRDKLVALYIGNGLAELARRLRRGLEQIDPVGVVRATRRRATPKPNVKRQVAPMRQSRGEHPPVTTRASAPQPVQLPATAKRTDTVGRRLPRIDATAKATTPAARPAPRPPAPPSVPRRTVEVLRTRHQRAKEGCLPGEPGGGVQAKGPIASTRRAPSLLDREAQRHREVMLRLYPVRHLTAEEHLATMPG